ncbi:MAG: hypothetical protein JWR19_772 [Pedosphaera sp.]|nr:hypothetical protein [Pedosphaera sp.]
MKYNGHQILRTKLLTLFTAVFAVVSILFYSGTVQAQSSISSIYPDGNYQFEPSGALSFTANSPAGITNVTVQLTVTSLYSGQSLIKNLTAVNGLTITGPTTGLSVSAVLKTNTLYSAVIQVKDANGSVASRTVSFDTIAPAYTWEAEDYDYTNGQFFANPQTNAYAGYGAIDGTDCHNHSGGNNGYRPNPASPVAGGPGGLATENCGDTPRLAHVGYQDYDVGWNDNGDWGNYTRNYPAGTYYVYMRGSSGSQNQRNADLAVAGGTAALTGTGTLAFKVPTTASGQTYALGPLLDGNGNYVTFTSDGSPSTLKLSVDQGGYNANFYLLMPTNIGILPVSTVSITNVYPDGTYQFQATNLFSFNASSPVSINPASDVTVILSATNLAGVGSVSVLTTANGLTVTGSSTNINVTTPLASNMVYTVLMQVSDANGNPLSYTVKFDTIDPTFYTFEAVDWDYVSGQFINNPQINAYSGQDGVNGTDFYAPTSQGSADLNRIGLSSETAHDTPRLGWYSLVNGSLVANTNPATSNPYITDDVNPGGGAWANYTRNYPAGTYNIFVRCANSGINGTEADCGSFSVVTSGQGTPSQTTSKLGSYSMVSSGGYQTYIWRPVMDAGGNLARFHADGSAITLRYSYDAAGANQGFYMLVPVAPGSTFKPFVSNFEPDGSALFQYTNQLSFTVISSVGMPSSGIQLNVDGVNVTGFTVSGTTTLWNVSNPVSVNGSHTAIVTVTDSVGTTSSTNHFDTFDPNTYTFESEDYNYASGGVGGQFLNNPVTVPGAYNGLSGIADVDDHWTSHSGSYRPSSGVNEGVNIEQNNTGTPVRPAFVNYNYDVGNNNGGNWTEYTRNYPAGNFNIWMRVGGPGNSPTAATISLVTNGWGTVNQQLQTIGTLAGPNASGWSTYAWVPIMSGGKLAIFSSNGGTNTIRETVVNGGYNQDFFALVPANTNLPAISGLYPNGSLQFQATNKLSFNAIASSGVQTNTIVVTLNGVALTNLVITGSSTNWNVSYTGLQLNTYYTVSIAFQDLNGAPYSSTYSFDTYSAAYYQWEAEDWDYTSNGISGLFVDNPQVDAYLGTESLAGVDVAQTIIGVTYNYRPNDINLVPATDVNGQSRPQFTGTNSDYRVNYFGYGSWCNYTRHYPAGTYYVLGRFTEGQAATVANLGKVTAGYGTSSQTVAQLGTFFIPLGNWSVWESVYLTDNNTNLVTVTLDGSQTTLRFSGNPVAANDPTINADYFMLVPVTPSGITLTASVSGGNIHISFPTQTGSHYQLLYKLNLTDASWIPLGSPIAGNNTVQSVNDSLSGGSHRFYRVQVQ